MKHGMSEETAWSLPDDLATACMIVLSEYEGNVFDWERGRFLTVEERKGSR